MTTDFNRIASMAKFRFVHFFMFAQSKVSFLQGDRNHLSLPIYNFSLKREVVDDNIKMEVPDMAKINFKNKVNTVEFCHVFAKEIWGQSSLLQHLKVHEGFQHQCNRCSYKTPTKKHLKGPINIPFRNNF